jgi:hypothetical protein
MMLNVEPVVRFEFRPSPVAGKFKMGIVLKVKFIKLSEYTFISKSIPHATTTFISSPPTRPHPHIAHRNLGRTGTVP